MPVTVSSAAVPFFMMRFSTVMFIPETTFSILNRLFIPLLTNDFFLARNMKSSAAKAKMRCCA